METVVTDLANVIHTLVQTTKSSHVWNVAQSADIGVPLARLIVNGYVTDVSQDGIDAMSDAWAALCEAVKANRS